MSQHCPPICSPPIEMRSMLGAPSVTALIALSMIAQSVTRRMNTAGHLPVSEEGETSAMSSEASNRQSSTRSLPQSVAMSPVLSRLVTLRRRSVTSYELSTVRTWLLSFVTHIDSSVTRSLVSLTEKTGS